MEREIIEIAEDIIKTACNSLLVNLRFMDTAINKIKYKPSDIDTVSLNAEYILYNPFYIIELYRKNHSFPSRIILHEILHCILTHFYVDEFIDEKCWGISCDITVENIINELMTAVSKGEKMKIGDIIEFGKYPQGKNGEIEFINWKVLDIKDNKALLISQYALFFKQINKYPSGLGWKTCDLRKWLRNSFYKRAFTKEEKQLIVFNSEFEKTSNNTKDDDIVSILSAKESENYFSNNEERKCIPTDYAIATGKAKDLFHDNPGNNKLNNKLTCCWWVKTQTEPNSVYYRGVGSNGNVYSGGCREDAKDCCVRPVIVIKVNI